MKIWNGFMQTGCIVVSQILLELAKCAGRSIEIFCVSALLQTNSIFNKIVYTPCAAGRICIIRITVFGRNYSHCLTGNISSAFADQISQIRSNTADIFHQCLWICKNICVDPLQNVSGYGLSCGSNQICVVDMSFAIGTIG